MTPVSIRSSHQGGAEGIVSLPALIPEKLFLILLRRRDWASSFDP